MDDERMIFRCGILAERLRTLAQAVALRAADRDSRAYAIVADETLKVAREIEDAVDAARFPDPGPTAWLDLRSAIATPAACLSLLAINAAIESVNSGGGAAIAICMDGIREAALELESLCRGEDRTPSGSRMPEPASPSLASTARDYMLSFSAGGARFLENFGYLREVMRYGTALPGLGGGELRLRDRVWPFIDLSEALGLDAPRADGRAVIVVRARWEGGDGREYAAAVDGLGAGAILRPRIGRPAEPKAGTPWAGLVRECWDAADDSQFLFLDWPGLSRD